MPDGAVQVTEVAPPPKVPAKFILVPEHIVWFAPALTVAIGLMVIARVEVVAQSPAVGVKVYVVVPGAVLIAESQVPVIAGEFVELVGNGAIAVP